MAWWSFNEKDDSFTGSITIEGVKPDFMNGWRGQLTGIEIESGVPKTLRGHKPDKWTRKRMNNIVIVGNGSYSDEGSFRIEVGVRLEELQELRKKIDHYIKSMGVVG